MKVLIIGAGIGGLTAYLALRKHLANAATPLTIKIYESHGSPMSTTSSIGGGLGVAPNGLRSLSTVSPGAIEYMQESGFPGPIMTFRNSSGRMIGQFSGGRKERYGYDLLMIRRAVVHEALLRDIPWDAVEWEKKVKAVRETDDRVLVEFSDGSSDNADLVLGADGVRSIVREAIFGDRYPAQYDGLTGIGGFIPLSSLSQRLQDSLHTEGVVMAWGSLGFFGYSMCTPLTREDPFIQWWSIYESPTPPPHDEDPSAIRAQLLERHGSWKSPYDSPDAPVYRTLINLGCHPDQTIAPLLVLPRYITPRIPHWTSLNGSGRIILLGDAAHAMPPDSGQGVSCAAEDAVALGLLLKHYGAAGSLDVGETLKRAAAAYETIRMKRVWHILDIAKRSGDTKKKKKWWQERIRDYFIWFFSKLPESINDRILAYDVQAAVTQYLRNNTNRL